MTQTTPATPLPEASVGHTPGPWESYGGGVKTLASGLSRDRVHGYGCANDFICSLNDGEYHEYWDGAEQVANARLIAAAPDLLDSSSLALQILGQVDALDLDQRLKINRVITGLRAAIARATGEA